MTASPPWRRWPEPGLYPIQDGSLRPGPRLPRCSDYDAPDLRAAFCSRAGRASALRRLLLSHNPTTCIELAVMTSRSLTFHRHTPPTPQHHDLRWALAYLIALAAILVFLTTSQ